MMANGDAVLLSVANFKFLNLEKLFKKATFKNIFEESGSKNLGFFFTKNGTFYNPRD